MNKIFSYIQHWREYLENRVSVRDQILYTKQIIFLLGANISLVESLQIIVQQTKKHKELFSRVISALNAGNRLTSVLEHQKIFSNTATLFLRSSEETGDLERAFQLSLEELQKNLELKQKIIGALLYPMIVIIGTLILVGALIITIFPRLESIFSSLHIQLPLFTRIIISGSVFLTQYWILIGLGIISFCMGTYYGYQYQLKMRIFILWMTLRVPVINSFVVLYYNVLITRILGLLLRNGVDLVVGLGILHKQLHHNLYISVFESAVARIRRGEMISRVFADHPELFRAEVISSLAVGERTGALADSFQYLATMFLRELDDRARLLSTSLEPVLMMVIGSIVLAIALSIITPMYQITNQLQVR